MGKNPFWLRFSLLGLIGNMIVTGAVRKINTRVVGGGIFFFQNNQQVVLMCLLLPNIFQHIVSLVLKKYWLCKETYCGVIGRHVEKDFRGTSAGHVSVAVPHTGNHVGLWEIQCRQKLTY